MSRIPMFTERHHRVLQHVAWTLGYFLAVGIAAFWCLFILIAAGLVTSVVDVFGSIAELSVIPWLFGVGWIIQLQDARETDA